MRDAADPIDAAHELGLAERMKGLAHMPDILPGTAEVRCGTCRFHTGKGTPGMGICLRYRGSLTMYVISWEACWHHQAAAVARAGGAE